MTHLHRSLLLVALLSTTAWVDAAEPSATEPGAIGTTIVGEQESAVGLYLMPWQEEVADDADRPPSRISEAQSTIDDRRFDANVKTQETIAAFRRSSLPRN